MRCRLTLLAWVVLLACARTLWAQASADSVRSPGSTLPRHEHAGRVDTALAVSSRTKSPGTAMLLSAVLPGAGQFYNASYWKVPVVLGFGVYFLSSWLDNNRRTQDYRQQFAASVIAYPPSGDPHLLAVREFYKEQRDAFTWYMVVLYLLNIADAYVDASLYDFNVGGDLSLQVLPLLQAQRGAQIGVRISF